VDTLCVLGRCQHRDAVDWVQCEQCTGWVHCICSGVNCKLARSKSYHFVCSDQQLYNCPTKITKSI